MAAEEKHVCNNETCLRTPSELSLLRLD